MWITAPLCLMWDIWKERNQVVFEDVEFLVSKIKFSFISYLTFWVGSNDVGEFSFVRLLLCILSFWVVSGGLFFV